MKQTRNLLLAAGAAALFALSACGGGSDSSGMSTPQGAAVPDASSGTITAFGSVFVNGHEFDTRSAMLVDDDTLATSADMSTLEVGMQVDVKTAGSGTGSQPVAAEVHVHPLARGVVDASDSGAGTLTVMGQTVQLTGSTLFSDHRACLTAATSPCAAITGQSGLGSTTGSGGAAVAGAYVTVHGYLFTSTAPDTNSIVATLIVVSDAPTTAVPAAYKAEGVVTAASGASLTIGALTVDLSTATCHAGAGATACSGAFAAGQIVSVFNSAAPALPATSFTAKTARLRARLPATTAGMAVEFEGRVANVSTSPAGFTLRGVHIDAASLAAGSSLPANGDIVRVFGTVSTQGNSIVASSVVVLHAARSASYGIEGDFSSVGPGSGTNTYVLTVLGQSVAIDSSARLADRSRPGGRRGDSAGSPFNIATFATYLGTSTSKHLLVGTQADASGNLKAVSVTIVPASGSAGISGPVDATPAPVNSSAAGSSSTFSVHAIPVSANPAAIHFRTRAGTQAIAAGNFVLARGTYAGGTLTVAAPSSNAPSALLSNFVLDLGPAVGGDHDCF